MSVLERDFLVPATWITVVDVSKCQVVIDGRRFRLDSPYSDGRPCLRLLDVAGRRSLEMPTATSPRQLAAILRSPPPGPVSLRRESVRWIVATITVVACLWYVTSVLADVWGTDKAASTWQLLVIPLILLPNYLVHESGDRHGAPCRSLGAPPGRRPPPLDRSVGERAAADRRSRGPVMELAYTNYTNVDAGFMRPYEPGDRLVRGHRGTIDVVTGENVMVTAERLYLRHNRDERPDGQLCPSMSIGDVVVIGEVAVSMAGVGFQHVRLDARDLITDRSWSDVISQPRPAVDPARTGHCRRLGRRR